MCPELLKLLGEGLLKWFFSQAILSRLSHVRRGPATLFIFFTMFTTLSEGLLRVNGVLGFMAILLPFFLITIKYLL